MDQESEVKSVRVIEGVYVESEACIQQDSGERVLLLTLADRRDPTVSAVFLFDAAQAAELLADLCHDLMRMGFAPARRMIEALVADEES